MTTSDAKSHDVASLVRRQWRFVAVLLLALCLTGLTAFLRVRDVPETMPTTRSASGENQASSLNVSDRDRQTLERSRVTPRLWVGLTADEPLEGDVFIDFEVPSGAPAFDEVVTFSVRFPKGATVQAERDGSVDCGVVETGGGSEGHVRDADGASLLGSYAQVECPIPKMGPGDSGFFTFAFTSPDRGAYRAGLVRHGSHFAVDSDVGPVGITLDPPAGQRIIDMVPAGEESVAGHRSLTSDDRLELSWVIEDARLRALSPLGFELSLLLAGVFFGLAPLAYRSQVKGRIEPPLASFAASGRLSLRRRASRAPARSRRRTTLQRRSLGRRQAGPLRGGPRATDAADIDHSPGPDQGSSS